MLKQINKSYCCIGLMSGTSLDGLDVAMCNLSIKDERWSYSFVKTTTIAYSENWKRRLSNSGKISGYELIKLHREYGIWLADQLNGFLAETEEKPDCIASHGHTCFHEPHNRINLQLGDGAIVGALTGITTISDFRSLDICLGGQGAPLVPIGDKLLFSEFDACVNLGGFANVSCEKNGRRVAWDICPLNFISNKLVRPLGLEYDDIGQMGREGNVIESLLNELNQLCYYQKSFPKSLGQEWVEKNIDPILNAYEEESITHILRTYYEHIAIVISRDLSDVAGQVLFTGGGVYNAFLMELIKSKLNLELVVPDQQLVEYKEALVFSLLGVLRYRNEINCLASVTGANRDNSSGVIHLV